MAAVMAAVMAVVDEEEEAEAVGEDAAVNIHSNSNSNNYINKADIKTMAMPITMAITMDMDEEAVEVEDQVAEAAIPMVVDAAIVMPMAMPMDPSNARVKKVQRPIPFRKMFAFTLPNYYSPFVRKKVQVLLLLLALLLVLLVVLDHAHEPKGIKLKMRMGQMPIIIIMATIIATIITRAIVGIHWRCQLTYPTPNGNSCISSRCNWDSRVNLMGRVTIVALW